MTTDTDITIDDRWLAETEWLAGEATAGPWKYELTDEGTVGVVFDSGHSVAWDLEGTCAQCFGTMEHIARVDPAAVLAWAAETRRAWAEVERLRAASADLVFSTRQMLVVLGRIARNQDHPDIHMTEVEFLQASVDRLRAALAQPGGAEKGE